MTTNEAPPDHLAELGHAPAYTCGKCGESVQANRAHICPAMQGALKPVIVAPPPDAASVAINTAGEVAALAARVATLEQQVRDILAGTPELPPDPDPARVEELLEPEHKKRKR